MVRKIRADIVFRTDYSNLDAVIALAKSFGPGHCVIKYPMRDNYNIIHAARADRTDAKVVYRT